MKIGAFVVRNPVLVNILMIVTLALGAAALARIPQEQFADVPFYFVFITVPYPGVSATDIERTVTKRIEDEMRGLQQVNSVESESIDGLSLVQIEFEDGITADKFETLFQEVRTRFSRIELPNGVLQENIDDFSSNDFLPVIQIAISGDIDYSELHNTAQNIADRLRTITDVSSVATVGLLKREIVVDLSRERVESLNISIETVSRAIESRLNTVPGGTLQGNSSNYILRTLNEVRQLEDINPIPIRETANGSIDIGDIATVSEVFNEDDGLARYNGKPAVILQVAKLANTSAVDIVDETYRVINEYSDRIPDGIIIDYFSDSTIQLRDSIRVLVNNALFGFVLVLILLFLFIGIRNAIMTALGIPISFALTFIVLSVLNNTLNSNVLFGLVLSLGLLVDHAIVIVENCYRQETFGKSKKEAAIIGVDQVIIPVIAATLTTVAAFLPLVFLPGIIGRFLRIVPVTVSIALIVSTFEAGYFIPAHYAEWPGKALPKNIDDGRYKKFRDWFGRVLLAIYSHRKLALLGIIIIMIGTFSQVGRIGQRLFSADDQTYFYIDINMPAGTPLEKTNEVVKQFEQRLLPLVGNGEVVAINSRVGFQSVGITNAQDSKSGQLLVDLEEISNGLSRSVQEILDETILLTNDIAGPERVDYRKEQSGPPTDAPVTFRLFGDDYSQLIAVSEAIKSRLAERFSILYNIKDNLEGGVPELRIIVDREKASRYGLTPFSVGNFIRGTFDGVDAGSLFRNNEDVDIIVRYDKQEISAPYQLQQLLIPAANGEQIPFSSIGNIEQANSRSLIRRLDGKREITIEAESLDTTNLRIINYDIANFFNTDLAAQYPEVILSVGGQFADFVTLLSDILIVLSIGIFLIYAILGAQFKSYTQPLLIICSVPFSFVGVVFYLLISRQPVSIPVIYASVALAGIAVNDSIVLISFINELRDEGVPLRQAIVEGAKTRLRPIILTSLTTIAGLLPTTLGIGGTSVVWAPMAGAISFGLLFSTVSALIIIPCIYGLFYDKKPRKKRRKKIASAVDDAISPNPVPRSA